MVPEQVPRAYAAVLVTRPPLTTLMFELAKMVPWTRKFEPEAGCVTLMPSSPGTLPRVRIALPGRLHWVSEEHWICTVAGSTEHVTAAESLPLKLLSCNVLLPLKQVW